MSETPGSYAGVRALQAGYEEGQAWRTLALALLPPTQAAVLRAVAYLTRIKSYPAGAPGWVAQWAIRQQVARPLSNSALEKVVALGLLEQYTNTYRLTDLGKRVAAALQEAARV